MNSKYKMFKQFMHNELGITKEDIKIWVEEAVKEVAYNHMINNMGEWDIKNKTERAFEKAVKDKVNTYAVLEHLLKNYDIKIEEKLR